MKKSNEPKDFNFRMLMPFDSSRPFAPLNYLQWIFNADGYDEILIRLLGEFTFEEHDKFTYICIDGEQRIRYDIEEKITYARENNYAEIEVIQTVEQLMAFFRRIKFNAIIEKAHNCNYGV